MAYLKARNIKKNFGGVKALVDGEVTLHKGKILGLLGANGSGKSTLSKIISGIYDPCGGTLEIDGKTVVIKNPQEAEKLGIVMVHQHLSLIPELSVWQNIILGREMYTRFGHLDDITNRNRAKKALFQITESIELDALVKQLSPAEKQMVEIAKGLSRNPKVLILDEPTAALEQGQVKILFDLLETLKGKGVAMIFISHRMWEVTKLCDYVSVFRNGNTVGHIDFEAEGIDEDRIVSMITGKSKTSESMNDNEKRALSSDIALKVNDLSMAGIVNGIDLTVRKGEILGIAGLHGQGQEELLMLLSGFMKKDKGYVAVNGKELLLRSPKEAILNKMVMVPGDRHEEGAFLSHSVTDNVLYPSFSRKKNRGLKGFFIDKKTTMDLAEDVIEKMNVYPPNQEMLISQFSGGNQQKVVVGKWLQIEPDVLLLSDPAKGVDVNAKEEMYGVIRNLADKGTAVVLYASDNEELIQICDRIVVMFEGRIVADLDAHGLTDESIVAASLGINKAEEVS